MAGVKAANCAGDATLFHELVLAPAGFVVQTEFCQNVHKKPLAAQRIQQQNTNFFCSPAVYRGTYDVDKYTCVGDDGRVVVR